jgi:ribosomal protein L11 methylase PrmA
MAFGTGEHPTTRGVIRLLVSLLQGGEVVHDLALRVARYLDSGGKA